MKITSSLLSVVMVFGFISETPARYYDPSIGRFLSPDALVSNAKDPQSLNRYSYTRNNPETLVDPSGHFFWVAILVGAAIGAYSAGKASDWNADFMLRGAMIGAVGGAIGAGIGTFAMGATNSALLSGIIGGSAGGASSGFMGATVFGGYAGIAMEQGALWGGISGGLAQGMVMKGIPDAFAQAGSGYLSGYWEGGRKSANSGAQYGLIGQLIGNALTMMGVGMDGRVPEKRSFELKEIQKTNDTFIVTPEFTMKDAGLLWMTIAFLTNGTEHTWHAKDQYIPNDGVRYYKRITSNVQYTGETPSKPVYRFWTNNCTTRFGYISPASYYANYNYIGPSSYWNYDDQ